MQYPTYKITGKFIIGAFIGMWGLLLSCQSGSDKASSQVTADSAQIQRDDQGMSQQQHDGLEAQPADSAQNPDSPMHATGKDTTR